MIPNPVAATGGWLRLAVMVIEIHGPVKTQAAVAVGCGAVLN